MSAEHVKSWRKRTKQRIVDSFGGKCGICGYDKYPEVFDLHHLSPEEKEFSFAAIRANPKNWPSLVEELRKCCLLCANCHRELHAGYISIPSNIVRFNESFSNYKKIELIDRTNSITNECPICKKQKPIWQQSCSLNCGLKLKGKYDWSKFNLYKLYVIDKISINQISKIVGCSYMSVVKRLKKEGFYKKTISHL